MLVIDDEFSVLRVLERLCSRLGHEVVMCKTAEDAIQTLQSDSDFDLILTDIVLPGVSGLEFLEWLEAGGFFNRVVIMTAYPNQEFVDFALKHGAIDVLTKPFNDLTRLSEKVNRWISGLELPATQV